MTQEDKQLLLKDLCARLPYGVKVDREWIAPMSGSPEHSIMEFDTFDIEVIQTSIGLGEEGNYRDSKMQGLTTCDDGKNHFVRGYMCKPYLRPMSSMTEKELEELNEKYGNIAYFFVQEPPYYHGLQAQHSDIGSIVISEFSEIYVWLNEHHFDYRGLIEKGLALEAPEGMYE